MEDYPTDEELKKIEDWSYKDSMGLVEFLKSIWWCPEFGFTLKGKRIKKLFLSTGGWSGNESIIGALKKNMFWMKYWQESRRGGHFYFKITKEGG